VGIAMAKKDLLPGLKRVKKAIQSASFTSDEFINASQAFNKLGTSVAEFSQGLEAKKAAREEFEKLSPEEKKKYLEAENQLQKRMDKTNYY
jgi:hypothetical protein